MINNRKILCVITARANSKGLKNKNILKISNKELLAYPIIAALKSKYIDTTLLSSDSKKYLSIGKKYGAYTPFLRPKSISNDKSTSYSVLKHAIKYLEKIGKKYEYLICLEPTSPLTTSKDLDKAIEVLTKTKCDSLVSIAFNEKYLIPYHFKKNKKNIIKSYLNKGKNLKRRQEINLKTFFLDGSLYMSTVDSFLKNKGFISNKTYGFLMPKHKSFEIDDKIDFEIIKSLFRLKK
jgi:CMP-N,N'-diacetyllegionaminic acid synthase